MEMGMVGMAEGREGGECEGLWGGTGQVGLE